MAALTQPEVKEVIDMGMVPPDVCCATINYFLKMSKPYYQFQQLTVGEQVIFFMSEERTCRWRMITEWISCIRSNAFSHHVRVFGFDFTKFLYQACYLTLD